MLTALAKAKEIAKSLSTLLSGIIIAVLAFGVDEPAAKYLAIAAVILGAVITWATPNAETPVQQDARLAGEDALIRTDGLSYEGAGGGAYESDPTDAMTGTPETTVLYESGDPEGAVSGNSVGAAPLEEDLPDAARPTGLG
ncbi:hypothetical protein [Aeromicrobium sp.]|uniref:hypothetical protein n=1 Tax=Aeromicrobium sp. TaxID=1871063 RepID=UPI0019843A2C|nr:hypothetical protein [Aeromicrobium sp.]MBC7630409.1 hypothetical protein [Aeromicrobium sp.]